MIVFKRIRWKNLLSTGNVFSELELNSSKTNLLVGKNGYGKCLKSTTEIDVYFDDKNIENIFVNFVKKR